jgi:sulfatase-like protein
LRRRHIHQLNGRVCLHRQAQYWAGLIGRRLPAPFRAVKLKEKRSMSMARNIWFGLLASIVAAMVTSIPAAAQQQKPNILFIMGDDIGWMQPRIYHQGLMVGETPNIDRIGQEGAKFTDYYAEQSCTAGRNAFFTGMLTPCMASR